VTRNDSKSKIRCIVLVGAWSRRMGCKSNYMNYKAASLAKKQAREETALQRSFRIWSEREARRRGKEIAPPFFGVFCVVVSFSQANVSCAASTLSVHCTTQANPVCPPASPSPSRLTSTFDLTLFHLAPLSPNLDLAT
jgi:hypothetical protein